MTTFDPAFFRTALSPIATNDQNIISVRFVRNDYSTTPIQIAPSNSYGITVSYNKEIAQSHMQSIFGSLSGNNAVKTLEIKTNGIGDVEVGYIASALEHNKGITNLSLHHNKIGADGAETLLRALVNNHTLTILTLLENEIGDSGVARIVQPLSQNNTLRALDLGYNDIGDYGTEAVAKALRNSASLTYIGLGYNRIGNDGVIAIANTLKYNHTLTRLDLQKNAISDAGIIAIADALKQNNTLVHLNLSSNTISSDAISYLSKALATNYSIQWLDLYGAPDAQEIFAILERNCSAKKQTMEILSKLTNAQILSEAEKEFTNGDAFKAICISAASNSALHVDLRAQGGTNCMLEEWFGALHKHNSSADFTNGEVVLQLIGELTTHTPDM